MRQALLVGVSAVVLGAAALVTAAPASAAPPACPRGWACFYTGPDGTGQVLIKQTETWQNLNGFLGISSIYNNQPSGDDACVADGPNGTGQTFCVDGGTVAPVPAHLLVRSVRG